MSQSHQLLNGETLITLLEIHRRNLSYLEQQVAKFGTLHVPVSLKNQIEDELRAINDVGSELRKKGVELTTGENLPIVAEVRHHTNAAEIHLRVGDIKSANRSFSRALDLMPSADLFLSCAKTSRKLGDEQAALTNLASAILLDGPEELLKEARFERAIIISDKSTTYMTNIWNEDIAWLKNHTSGRELGEVIFLEARHIYGGHLWTDQYNDVILHLLDEAITLGCDRPEAYYYRSESHFYNSNFGCALKDVKTAINLAQDDLGLLTNLLEFEIWLISRCRSDNHAELNAAFEMYAPIFQKTGGKGSWPLTDIGSELLYQCAFDYKFARNSLGAKEISSIKDMVQFLIKQGFRLPAEHKLVVQIITDILKEAS